VARTVSRRDVFLGTGVTVATGLAGREALPDASLPGQAITRS